MDIEITNINVNYNKVTLNYLLHGEDEYCGGYRGISSSATKYSIEINTPKIVKTMIYLNTPSIDDKRKITLEFLKKYCNVGNSVLDIVRKANNDKDLIEYNFKLLDENQILKYIKNDDDAYTKEQMVILDNVIIRLYKYINNNVKMYNCASPNNEFLFKKEMELLNRFISIIKAYDSIKNSKLITEIKNCTYYSL